MVGKLNFGVLELDLEKVMELVKEILCVRLDPESRDAVKRLVQEVTKAYDDIIDSYASIKPLRKSDKLFEEKFPVLFEQFERTYLKSSGTYLASCTKIHEALNDLVESKRYMVLSPKVREKIKKFKDSADAWFLNDSVIYDAFKKCNDEIYKELSTIEKAYGNEPTAESRNRLDEFVSKWDKELQVLKTKKDEFASYSIKL